MMDQKHKLAYATEIMNGFAEETGVEGGRPPRRYLWTDAFAVCNFLGLHRLTGDERYRTLALALVDQVHQVLGRHRDDDPRTGWLSGLDEEAGLAHPTRGGLRIGKPLPERQPGEAYDDRLEWDRDGQYFHYLTKWMHALHQVSLHTGEDIYNLWALELAEAAHAAFVYRPSSPGGKRMYWKMSIDLSRPQVPAMGHHDPLDGYITYIALQAAAPTELEGEIIDMKAMCENRDWTTDDPLGLGGILGDALRVAKLMVSRRRVLRGLLENLLASAAEGLQHYARTNPLLHPAEYRLAFRELGLAIGMHAAEEIRGYLRDRADDFEPAAPLREKADRVAAHRELGEMIGDFWLLAENRQVESWTSHRDINMVMLATCLVPSGFLGK